MGMKNRDGYIEFLTSDSYKNQTEIWYKAYNITREKTELYYDFLVSLLDLIEETFLGPDVLQSQEDIKNHFTWCFDKVINNFKKESIEIKSRGNHYEYLWLFFQEAFYQTHIDGDITRIREYFYKLFDFSYKKSRSELDMLTDLYKLFEQNLKK
jgi:hypothetical protein